MDRSLFHCSYPNGMIANPKTTGFIESNLVKKREKREYNITECDKQLEIRNPLLHSISFQPLKC